ncbi:MAG: hypothetical protein HZC48_09600 [Nitrospirae bacterium]|nr:hypothetical protein [Nitrospirota bacterium]
MKKMVLLLVCCMVMFSSQVNAGWHPGTVQAIEYGYDGQTVVITLNEFDPQGCTCYPTWDGICLDRSRATYKEELATLLLAKATGALVNINIDEASCLVKAVGLH